MQEHIKLKVHGLAQDCYEAECKEHVCACKQCQTSTADTSLSITFEQELGKDEDASPQFTRLLSDDDTLKLLNDPDVLALSITEEINQDVYKSILPPKLTKLAEKTISMPTPLRLTNQFTAGPSGGSKLLRKRTGQDLILSTPSLFVSSLDSSVSDDFSVKYSFSRLNLKGSGSSASCYALSENSDSASEKVVKVYNTVDEATVDAAHNEVNILQKLPKHDNVVQYHEHYFQESLS